MRLLLLREPRALVLATDDYALVFRQPPGSTTGPSVVVEFIPVSEVDLSGAVSLNGRISGCLGLLMTAEDTWLPVITSSTTLGSQARSMRGVGCESTSRILAVEFYCLTSSTYDFQTTSATDVPDSYAEPTGIASPAERLEHPCAGLRKIFSNMCFYYSSGEDAFDLSTRLEARLARQRANEKGKAAAERDGDDTDVLGEEFDPRFLWNTFLVSPLLTFRASLPILDREVFDRQAFVALVIQGFVGVYDLQLGGQPAVLTLVSRLGWKRAGTRFNVRGVDDDGSVANFVETETILRTPAMCLSYVQVRGSVPFFWEETGVQPFGLKITVTRPIEASLPAFLRHFDDLLENYSSIHIVNLLSSKDQEATLTAAYESHLSAATLVDEDIRDNVSITNFDFHARKTLGGIDSVKSQLATSLGPMAEQFGACLIGVGTDGKGTLVMGQRGVLRTNCKDCLDRTNVIQDILSTFALEDFIRNTNPAWNSSDSALWGSHRVLFAENGDCLSKIYVGTGALNTSFTRSGKQSFAGLLSNATKSVGRMYAGNFTDASKQKAIDSLLGNLSGSQKVRVFDPINDALHVRLKERASEYTSYETFKLWTGTYNLNGKSHGSESLLPWIFPAPGVEPEILVFAFQEIVPLTPQMIMATDPENKRQWEAFILKTLAERPDKKFDYILLRSDQLVGTALIVLIKKALANEVRNVEATTKKTGLKGMAGNKGAVAIRLDFRDTSLCFLTSHFAAGHSAVDERCADYFTIADTLHFQRGKKISHHDNIVWAADTNYRISLANEDVRRLAQDDNFAALLAADQLAAVMRTRGVFSGYVEGPILFRPTYKYDNGTDNYDTSEKARIPAWTDRILYAGPDLDLGRYQRAELMSSDHRPVYAVFRLRIRSIDHAKRTALRTAIRQEILAHAPTEKLDDKMSRITSRNLPPPSDDSQAWWNGPDHPDGTHEPDPAELRDRDPTVSNPFADDFLRPQGGPPPRVIRKPPPPIPNKLPVNASPTPALRRKPPPLAPRPIPLPVKDEGHLSAERKATVRRSPSSSSLLDDDEDKGGQGPSSWQPIIADQAS